MLMPHKISKLQKASLKHRSMNKDSSSRTYPNTAIIQNQSPKPSFSKQAVESDAVYAEKLAFQETEEDGGWIRMGGEIRGKKRQKRVLYVGLYQ